MAVVISASDLVVGCELERAQPRNGRRPGAEEANRGQIDAVTAKRGDSPCPAGKGKPRGS